jgi:hypothetical protein
VEFGLSSGFIHVIDDEQDFPRTFGADVVAGVLEIPGEVIARLKRKPAQEVIIARVARVARRLLLSCYLQERAAMDMFSAAFDEFDWTKPLRA